MRPAEEGKRRWTGQRRRGYAGGERGTRVGEPTGEDASATGLMLLPGFLSSKRKLEEGRIARARSLARRGDR